MVQVMEWRVGRNKKRLFRGNLLLLVSFLLLSGCVPYPRTIQIQPAIEGEFRESGRAISGVEVRYSTKFGDATEAELCDSDLSNTRTDREGRFAFPGVTESAYTLPLVPVHAGYGWNLCFERSDGTVQIWRGGSYGPLETPEKIVLDCESHSREREERGSGATPYFGGRLCRYQNLKAHVKG